MEDCCIVLNPNARAARELRLVERLPEVLAGVALRVTKGAGEGEFLAREAAKQGYRTVIAAGGDGTINEVLCGLVGTSARLGVLPVGTVNVFAREMGLPLDWEEALYRAVHGKERLLDVGWANGAPFLQLAGVGFDAEAVERVNPTVKRLFGPAAYVLSGIEQLSKPWPKLRIEADGLPDMEGRWVLVGMGRYYGGAIPVFPMANHSDGLLDVLVIQDVGWLASLRYLAGIPLGWHTRMAGVEYFQTSRLRVEGDSALELDGEAKGRGAVDFSVSRSVLRVVV